ncbi:MAG: 4a-hydroxytetrahydrobiopterin dehydratase [Gemmatimonadetes bacterium]|nr:4a-hydroxytetrahydrobiopterin dehydratase [Gemmatimonadota bacterium]
MPSPLAQQQCVPCKGGTPPLTTGEREHLLEELGGGWAAHDAHHLHKEYTFENFVDALAFTNRVGAVAEEQGHHPDILLTWGKVGIKVWTHAIDGLTASDFILAAKADAVL